MYITEFVEIILTKKTQPGKWEKDLGFRAELNTPLKVHWSILITKRDFRGIYLNIQCDDCKKFFNRRIMRLNPNINTHYCKSCIKKGKRNPMYGTTINENFKRAHSEMMQKGNPFTWESTKKILKEKQIETTKKVVAKNTGKKRSKETCKKISQGLSNSYKNGRRKSGWGWNNIKIKKYKDIDYQGTYELNFLKFIDEKGKLNLIERGPRVSYFMDDIEHNYYIDYRIKNTNIVFEIKSDYYWKKGLRTNLLKKKYAEKEYEYYLIINNRFKILENILNKL